MLFDLRSRGRRRTVQVVYLGLAIVLGGGLILFGVGTGSGLGGLLNAFTGSGSNQQGSVISQQVKTAEKQVKATPNSAAAWANLVSARWESADGTGFDSSTNSFTSFGKQQLAGVGTAYEHYTQLAGTPDASTSILAARAYDALGQYSQAAQAWDANTVADPGSAVGYQCLAISAYAAGQTREGDLAAAKTASLVPKANRKTLLTEIQGAKTNHSLAQTSC
jgi:hypothetical protein